MTARSKQVVKLFIRIIVTISLLVLVFRQIDFGQFWQTVRMGRWEFLLAVWIFTIILFWIRCITLQLILRKQNCNIKVATLFRASVISSLYSMIMPGMLSTGAKWYILKKDTGKGTNVFSSMVYNQLSIIAVATVCGLAALILTNPTAIIMNNPENRWLLPVLSGILLVTIALVSALLLNSRTGGKVIQGLRFLLKLFPLKICQKGQEILDQIAIFQVVGWRFHATIAFIAMGGTFIGAFAIFLLAARAANIDAPPVVFLWLWPFIYIVGRLPISFANLGIREISLVEILSLYGVEKSSALLMSMILFSALILMAMIGAVLQFSWVLRTKHITSKQIL
jgi:uncharacterized membrane protein YbhN (UPF0104 family)